MREAGFDAVRKGVFDQTEFLERQEAFGLKLVFPVRIVAAGPEGTFLTGTVVQTEFGFDLL